MAKNIYNSKSGTVVVAGQIKSIAEDRTSMVLEYTDYDSEQKKDFTAEVTVKSPTVLEDKYRVGFGASVVGIRGRGNTLTADAIFIGNETIEIDGLAIISGTVKRASFYSGLDENGNPKLKDDGVTKQKPHFDITVGVRTEAGGFEDHIIHIYKEKDGDSRKMDAAKKLFKDFDRESNPMKICAVTSPGNKVENDRTVDGKTYHNVAVYHLGHRFLSAEFLKAKEKQADKVPQPAPAAPAVPKQEPEPEFAEERDEWGE